MHEYGPLILIFVAVLVGILFNRHDIGELKSDMNRQLDKIDVRLDKVDARLDRVDARLDRLDVRFDQTDARLDKIDMRLDRIDQDLKQFHGTDKLLEGRVDELSKRVA